MKTLDTSKQWDDRQREYKDNLTTYKAHVKQIKYLVQNQAVGKKN